jgi:16S rRNA A1518/A1519 N6-dimethyltransferase RsmA/KsgA/DIM1 with predicted DNA glycosylase/AP lyase activity
MNGNDLKKEFGDYQTPDSFAETVCNLLRDGLNLDPAVVIEPTLGLGNFLNAALNTFHSVKKAIGLEINPKYCSACKKRIADERLQIINDNFFSYQIEKHIEDEDTLFLGNPPWATNSELNFNLPEKENFKGLSGTDAITGASNFDICEYIILKLIEKSINKKVSIAMLCKTSVARNVLLELDRNDACVDMVNIYNFNSTKIFGISASACLLYIKMSITNSRCRECDVYAIDNPDIVIGKITFENGKLSNSNEKVIDLDGECSIEWRQGVKHDCAGVMELEKKSEHCYKNKNKEEIELEDSLVFPLMKSSSFKRPIINTDFKKYVIVTQKKAREETDYIEKLAPKTWKYLCERKEAFDSRKSSIYKGAPAFSMFGVGDYSYADYKVGISGFYKKPLFALLYNEDRVDQPIMVDDTSYFLSFDNYSDAYTCMLLLNSARVQEFLLSISFQDAKRPYTKKVLQRLDFNKCIQNIAYEELADAEKELGLPEVITPEMYSTFANYIIGLKNVG